MTTAEALISGVIQGATEFLPVSSSGHLVLVHSFFGFSAGSNIFFDLCLHAATLMAVILFFWRDIAAFARDRDVKEITCFIIGTVPAVVCALLFEDRIEQFFMSPAKVMWMLVVTAFILFAGQAALLRKERPEKRLTPGTSLFVGAAQAFALIPGISRSGATVSAGLVGGLGVEKAFRFSFLLSIPVIAGAIAYKTLTIDVKEVVGGDITGYLGGMAAAFITGLLSLRILWWVMRGKKLYLFGIYCLSLGIAGLFFLK
ncbi:MAG: undecaprenyl-diphosphate phosphatase [Candidatus Omnitrophota bacterium]